MSDKKGGPAGSYSFFAAWMLLHEKADDWLRDAVRRARETPDEMRRDYQTFLLGVEKEKESLKGLFSEALVCEFRHLGFVHKADEDKESAKLVELEERLRGLEEQLERLKSKS